MALKHTGGACTSIKGRSQFGELLPPGLAHDTMSTFGAIVGTSPWATECNTTSARRDYPLGTDDPNCPFKYYTQGTYHDQPLTLGACQNKCAKLEGCRYVSWQARELWPGNKARCYVHSSCWTLETSSQFAKYDVYSSAPANDTLWGHCKRPDSTAVQVNVQLGGSADSVVVSFLTTEPGGKPWSPPTVEVVPFRGTVPQQHERFTRTGITHEYHVPSGDQTYYFHFLPLEHLDQKHIFRKDITAYGYRVKSGSGGAPWSKWRSFRAAPPTRRGGETRVDIFGDMGVYHHNNMANLLEDCRSGDSDAIVHMGDHAYNIGEDDEARGNGYMQAYDRVLSDAHEALEDVGKNGFGCPFMPIVGNHEIFDGENLARFLNQTWGGHTISKPIQSAPPPARPTAAASLGGSNHQPTERSTPDYIGGRTTAETPLGFFMARANQQGGGRGGPVPSETSRYFGVDFGLIHFAALDLNVYNGADPYCDDVCKSRQLSWLEEDLAAVDRRKTPWVVVMSHYPLYCTGCATYPCPVSPSLKEAKNKNLSSVAVDPVAAYWYASNEAEYAGNGNMSDSAKISMAAARQEQEARLGLRPGLDEDKYTGWGRSKEQAGTNMIADIVPIMNKHKVDLYMAGHDHSYESLWPFEQTTGGCGGAPLQYDFNNPKVPVYITSGNAGPPSLDQFNIQMNLNMSAPVWELPATRVQSQLVGYGRLVAHNASHITFMQLRNNDSVVVDEFTIVQDNHNHHGF